MSVRTSVLFVSLLLAAGQAGAAPVPTAPGAVPFRVGALELVALRDELNVVPNDGSVFGTDVGPEAVGRVLGAAGADRQQIPLGVDALLVRTPGHLVLIDSGLGPKAGGVLLASLKLAGFTPAQVTDVLITHTHGDHVGGLLDAAGKPAFPNAVVRMSAAEWGWLKGKPAQAALATAIESHVRTFSPGTEVLPGIGAVALTGHTPGHVGYRIRSGGESLLDIGDSAHSAVVSLAEPGWVIEYDTDAAAGRASRERLLAELAARHQRVFAPHFPFPGVGRVEKAGAGYSWQPDQH